MDALIWTELLSTYWLYHSNNYLQVLSCFGWTYCCFVHGVISRLIYLNSSHDFTLSKPWAFKMEARKSCLLDLAETKFNIFCGYNLRRPKLTSTKTSFICNRWKPKYCCSNHKTSMLVWQLISWKDILICALLWCLLGTLIGIAYVTCSVLNVGRHFWNVGRHFVFKPSPPRHPHPHLKWRFGKCRPTFREKSDMSADIFPKCRPTFWEKPIMLIGLGSWSNWEILTMD